MEVDEEGARESEVLSSRMRIQLVILQTENPETGSRHVLFRDVEANCLKSNKRGCLWG